MEFLKILLLLVAIVMVAVMGLQLFARWKMGKLVGKEIPERFGKEGILYFYSPSCGACRRMEPVIRRVSDRVKVDMVDISKKDGLELARSLGILGTPATIFFEEGRVSKVFLGYQREDKLMQEVGS